MLTIIGRSYGDRRLDSGMGIVMFEREIAEAEVEDRGHRGVQGHGGQRPRLARELEAGLLDMVRIEVDVAEGEDELAGLKLAHLSDHERQQRVGSDVERHAEKDVGAALVELARQPAIRDVELEERVA